MSKIALSILFSLTIIHSAAQISRIPVASVYTKIGAYTKNHSDAFSMKANQASLAEINSLNGGLYGEQRFMLNELSFYQLAFALPTNSGNFGISGTYFGSNENNETELGFAYGRKLGNKVSVGAQFNYYAIEVAGYGSASSINFETEMLLHVNEQIHVGLHVYNPTGSVLNKGEEERLPSIYHVGIGYEASSRFFVSAEIEKMEDFPVSVNGGMQYSFGDKMFARAGFTSGNSLYYFGCGVTLPFLRIDATASVHPQLGVTPGLLLLFKKKNKN